MTATTFTPGITIEDPLAACYLQHATLRLRREICWLQYERGQIPGSETAALPPYTDRLMESLDMARFHQEKQRFFAEDPTASWLSNHLAESPPLVQNPQHGSFSWLVQSLDLQPAASFALALALLAAIDNAAGNVIAAILNDAHQTLPNLALIQRLWDEPEQTLQLAAASHPLWTHGLLIQSQSRAEATEWERPFISPPVLARTILFPNEPPPHGLDITEARQEHPPSAEEQLATAALQTPATGLRIQPITGSGDISETAARIAGLRDKKLLTTTPGHFTGANQRAILATCAWLKNCDLLLEWESAPSGHHHQEQPGANLPNPGIPATLFLAIKDPADIKKIPANTLPALRTPQLDYHQRYNHWLQALGSKANGLEPVIAETARRFRISRSQIDRLARNLMCLPGKLESGHITSACRSAFEPDMGHTAKKVQPRFAEETLVLPPKQHRQFREVEQAMRALTTVHYGWGTAKAWNEGGVAVLFGGPPGTGKTMGAEVLASRLDLPMYRIDLSQIVSKYIGETEKNLSALFDAADSSDTILFFDEADALFGKRSEVKDSHDRYANLEISYLLERMERFKGLAILATNRKKDLDEAFLRRLRFIIDFPLPGEPEREAIWRQVIPSGVCIDGVDFKWLARQFPLAGGHIRSIAFNACLQAAGETIFIPGQTPGTLKMEDILIAVKREYQKLDRTISRDRFGTYAPLIAELET